MYARKPRGYVRLLIIVSAVVVLTLIGSAVGKYLRSFVLEDATVTFTAKLAESITLQEHKAKRLPDGSYELDHSTTVTSNEYTLVPGLDVPKDPHIIIEGKTPIDSYLFVEVVDETTNQAISYTMTDAWKKLDIEGKNGGDVYVYTGEGTDPMIVDEAMGANFTVFLLENDRITVGQKLLSGTDENTLTFYACMGETAFSQNTDLMEKAREVYSALNNHT